MTNQPFKNSKFWQKILAVLSLFAFTMTPVESEARTHKGKRAHSARAHVKKAHAARKRHAPRRARTAKVRTPRASKARVARVHAPKARVARVHAPKVRAIRGPRISHPSMRAHQAAVAKQQAALARQQALARQRAPQWNALMTHNFQADKTIGKRMSEDSRNPLPMIFKDFTQVDIGYGANRARTAQYNIGMPAAPVLHPYHMDQDFKGYQAPMFLLNAKFQYNPDFGPKVLHRTLTGINPANIDCFLEVQTMPYYADAGNPGHLLQLKPQSWLNPNAPYQIPGPNTHDEPFTVSVGVFPVRAGGPRLQGQVGDNLIENHPLSIHNYRDKNTGVFHPVLISSGPTLNLAPLDTNVSQRLFSVTKHGNRAAIVQHVCLTNADGDEFSNILTPATTLQDVVQRFKASKRLGHFATLDEKDFL